MSIDYTANRAWLAMCKGMDMGRQGGINHFLELAADHYWDSLESQKDLVLLHLQAIAQKALEKESSAQEEVGGSNDL